MGDPLGVVAGDHDDPLHADASRHAYGPLDERHTAYPQERLGAIASDRTQPLRVACGQYDGRAQPAGVGDG